MTSMCIVELYVTVNDIKQFGVAQKCLTAKFLLLATVKFKSNETPT